MKTQTKQSSSSASVTHDVLVTHSPTILVGRREPAGVERSSIRAGNISYLACEEAACSSICARCRKR